MKNIVTKVLTKFLKNNKLMIALAKYLIKRVPLLNSSFRYKFMNFADSLAPETIMEGRIGNITLHYPSKSCKAKLYLASGWRKGFFEYFFERCLSDSRVIIEVGANIGIDTINMARRLGKDSRIIAFEPADKYRQLLIQNIETNNIKNVEVYGHLLDDRGGRAYTLYLNSASASIIKDASPSFPSIASQVIEKSISIDTFIRDRQIRELDFLKVDTDGCDLFVLKGGKETIDRFHPKIMVEFSGYSLKRVGESNLSLAQLLFAYGYTDFVVIWWGEERPPTYFDDYAELVSSLDEKDSVDVISVHQNDKNLIPLLTAIPGRNMPGGSDY